MDGLGVPFHRALWPRTEAIVEAIVEAGLPLTNSGTDCGGSENKECNKANAKTRSRLHYLGTRSGLGLRILHPHLPLASPSGIKPCLLLNMLRFDRDRRRSTSISTRILAVLLLTTCTVPLCIASTPGDGVQLSYIPAVGTAPSGHLLREAKRWTRASRPRDVLRCGRASQRIDPKEVGLACVIQEPSSSNAL
jgi:hypothetical protein